MDKGPLAERVEGNHRSHSNAAPPRGRALPRFPARRRQDKPAAPGQEGQPAEGQLALVVATKSAHPALAPNGNPHCWYHPDEVETDTHRLAQRARQIEYGRNTPGYAHYLQLRPKHLRKRSDPSTPDKTMKCSKRCFDGIVKSWRRQLHKFDPENADGTGSAGNTTPKKQDLEDSKKPVAWEQLEAMTAGENESWGDLGSEFDDTPLGSPLPIGHTPPGSDGVLAPLHKRSFKQACLGPDCATGGKEPKQQNRMQSPEISKWRQDGADPSATQHERSSAASCGTPFTQRLSAQRLSPHVKSEGPMPAFPTLATHSPAQDAALPFAVAASVEPSAVSISDAFKTGMFKSTLAAGGCGVSAGVSHVEAAQDQAWDRKDRLDANVDVEPETFSISMAAPVEEWMLVAMDEGSRGA